MRAALPIHHADDAGRDTVLCVDDDPVVQIMLSEVVRNAGAVYHRATTAGEAEERVLDERFDLILLDRRLPDSDGLLLIQTIRQTSDCPVFVLSELGEARDRQLGIGLGATDYMTKPFSPNELSSRIRHTLIERARRREMGHSRPVSLGGVALHPGVRRLTVGGQHSYLPPNESRLLHVLLENPEQALSRDMLSHNAFGRDWTPGDRTIDVLVARLRKRLGGSGISIVTVHRTGYLLARDAD
ncbi:MAG: response regulator transcription factor [Pseudomonadota bacterium]